MLLTARWVLPITSPPIEDGAILVRGERIAGVGKKSLLLKQYPGEPVWDFGEAILMPGLVNAHSHLDYTILRGIGDGSDFVPWILKLISLSQRMTPSDFVISASLGALEAIRSGITCLADTTDRGGAFHAVCQAGLRAVIYREVFGMEDTRIEATVRRLVEKVKDMKQQAGSRVKIGVSPHAPYTVSPGLFRRVHQLAREEGLPVCLHLAESLAESDFTLQGTGELASTFRRAVGWGRIPWYSPGDTPVQYLERLGVLDSGVLAAHCVHVTAEDISTLAGRKVAVAHCPKSNAKLGNGLAPLPAFLDTGLRVGLGTDSAASNDIIDLFEEMRFAIMLQRATHQSAGILEAARLVEMATLGGARAIGLDEQIGSLEEGKKADIIGINLAGDGAVPAYDPYSTVVFSTRASDVIFTMVDGQVLYANGDITTVDAEEVASKARRLARKLSRRL